MKKKFIENFLSLSMLRVLTLVVPLLTYPYLIRVLGSEKYGLVMWAWSIVNFFILFINFGFDLSVTKYVAVNRNNKDELSKIISTTIATKVLLFLIASFFYLVLITFIPKIHSNEKLFFLTFLMAISETIMPIWYFQGIEKMKYTALITSGIKIGFTILVFLIIKKPDDFLLVPVLYAISGMISGIFAYYLIFAKDKNRFIIPKVSDIVFYIKDSTALFLSNSVSVAKDSITIIFIEQFIGLKSVAYYDIVQKFVNILITPFHILASVLFPHLSKSKDFRLLKTTIFISTIISMMLYLLVYFFSDEITLLLYGKENAIVVSLISVISIAIIFANLASLLGTTGLIVAGRNKRLLQASIYSFILFIIMLSIPVIFHNISLVIIAYIIIATYSFDFIFRMIYMKDLLWGK